jgi:hypothetical protein
MKIFLISDFDVCVHAVRYEQCLVYSDAVHTVHAEFSSF